MHAITLALLLLFAVSAAHADLIDIGGGMVYDSALDVTWQQDPNYAQTSGYDADGLMTFDEANTWAATLIHGGTGGWRLPTFDSNNPRPGTATSANEIGSLLMELTGGGFDLYYPYDVSPFMNLPHLSGENSPFREVYWTGLAGGPGLAWDYYMGCG